MKTYLSFLKSIFIFESCSEEDIICVLECLESNIKKYDHDTIIHQYHDHLLYAGIILKGSVNILMLNGDGTEYVARHVEKGELFGEAYACTPSEHANIQITAYKNTSILYLKLSNLFSPKAITCSHASKVTAKLLQETAKNNIFQNKKIQIITQKHIRDRLLLYLSEIADHEQTVTLPFNRQLLANYLNVDRSSLSRELSNMKKEGILDYHQNTITMKIKFF